MRVAVLGATGTIGRPLVAALSRAGHEARELSRSSASHPVDLRSGAGLEPALAGCEVVVDAANAGPSPAPAREVLVEGGRRLLAAESAAGVGHHVCISIVGIDRAPLGYYRVKLEQEEVVRAGPTPWTIVRSSQFHGLVAAGFEGAGRFRVLPGGRALVQPVDPEEVAALLAELAAGPALGRTLSVAGPEVHRLGELARTWARVRDRRAVTVPMPLFGRLGRALRAGALTDDDPDHRARRGFEQWLRERTPR